MMTEYRLITMSGYGIGKGIFKLKSSGTMICLVFFATEKGPFGVKTSCFSEQIYHVIYAQKSFPYPKLDDTVSSLSYTTRHAHTHTHSRHCQVLTLRCLPQNCREDRQRKCDIHAVKYTTCLVHHTNMPHHTTHQLATHGS